MPYWRLSAVYFCYFAVVGAISPYWGLYLDATGYSPTQIGVLSAIPMLTKLLAPNIWGAWADATGQRLNIIRLGAAGACLCFAAIFVGQGYIWLIVVLLSFSFFWNAILAQFEVVTLNHLASQPQRYSRIRVWGSVGFILTVVLLGYLFELIDIRLLPLIIFIFLCGIFFSTLSLPEEEQKSQRPVKGSFLALLLNRNVFLFFFILTLLQVSHGVYYTFYSIYMESYGYSRTLIGLFWAIGVVAEIVIFIWMPAILQRFSLLLLLQASLFLTALRWAAIACYPELWGLMITVQLLHAFGFGVSHAVAIEFVRRQFGSSAQGQGQAFYSAVCFGAGSAVGALCSGLLWELKPSWAFVFSIGVVVIALLISHKRFFKGFSLVLHSGAYVERP
ncbi:MFS transporter, PPP family, 3-phenylpropionic acid transporter [Alteromonadaceae bacterium Bs31]|nr:MFS transporter, PPP family, 3-phenylpropionic acid transporter [Alteromonadaceae bacterium Bs31]